jgi:aryl-alcohol dehydrogenase-like predicted oxidoreductase
LIEMRLAAPPARPRCAKRSIDRDAAPCTAGSAAPPLPRRRGAATAATRRALLAAPLAAGVAAAAGPTLATAAAAAAPAVERGPLFPGSDIEISRVVKGCWQLGGGHGGERASDRTAGSAAVADFAAFARQGVTTLDTADIYGASEGLVGKYLASSAEARAATQVLTKSCYFGAAMDRARDGAFVRGSVAASAKRLGLGALDLVQFYWHDYENQNLIGAGLHLAELAAAGKVRALGATNFDTARLAALVDAGVPINVHQTQYSLLDTRPDNGMAAYCLANGISLLPYGTVAGGFLSVGSS